MFSRLSLLVPALSLMLVVGAALPAEAASPTIRPIKAAKADYKAKVRVKPSYRVPSGVQVSKARLTVKSGGKTVARNKASVALKAGKYRVTQTLTYRTFRYARRSVVAVRAGTRVGQYGDTYSLDLCSYTAVNHATGTLRVNCPVSGWSDTALDYVRLGTFTFDGTFSANEGGYGYLVNVAGHRFEEYLLEVGELATDIDSVIAPKSLYVSERYRAYSSYKSKKRAQTLIVKQRPKPRGCSRPADIRRVKNGMDVRTVRRIMQNSGKVTYSSGDIVLREYKTCDKYDYMSVSFEDGYVYDKTLMDW